MLRNRTAGGAGRRKMDKGGGIECAKEGGRQGTGDAGEPPSEGPPGAKRCPQELGLWGQPRRITLRVGGAWEYTVDGGRAARHVLSPGTCKGGKEWKGPPNLSWPAPGDHEGGVEVPSSWGRWSAPYCFSLFRRFCLFRLAGGNGVPTVRRRRGRRGHDVATRARTSSRRGCVSTKFCEPASCETLPVVDLRRFARVTQTSLAPARGRFVDGRPVRGWSIGERDEISPPTWQLPCSPPASVGLASCRGVAQVAIQGSQTGRGTGPKFLFFVPHRRLLRFVLS